jgi:HSP20 family protein
MDKFPLATKYLKKEVVNMAMVPWRKRGYSWGPLFELDNIQKEMNKLFDFSLARWLTRDGDLLERAWRPAIDIYDSKDNIVVKADLPGMSKDEIEVSVHNDTLTIKGEKKQEKEVREKDYVRSERLYGSFNRTIILPAEVDTSKVTATYKNGVLELTLPKKEEVKAKQIKIDVQ